jgi:hypothetical protein
MPLWVTNSRADHWLPCPVFPESGRATRPPLGPLRADTVAKVVLQWWSEILRAADATFV